MQRANTRIFDGDLPDDFECGQSVAIDTETMGLHLQRDRLCLVQLSTGDGTAILVRIGKGQADAPNLARMLADPGILKIFHFGRFDIAVLNAAFGVMARPVYCTKIASKLARTYTDQHGLKVLTKELLGIEIEKEQQSSDWGAASLTDAQVRYAANDVIHLHRLQDVLDAMLAREQRKELADACFAFLPERVRLDMAGWTGRDIFAH